MTTGASRGGWRSNTATNATASTAAPRKKSAMDITPSNDARATGVPGVPLRRRG